MEGDRKVVLDVCVEGLAEEEASSRTASSGTSWRKLTGALLAIGLCCAVAVFCSVQTKAQDPSEDSNGLRHALRQISGSVRAAIHVEGSYNRDRVDSMEWNKDVDHYHAEGGLELVNNEIVIPRPGLYFVYSQAAFRVSCRADEEDSDVPLVHLSHTVERRSKSFETSDENPTYRPILHSIRTACEKTAITDAKFFGTVYMGAVFKLNKGDRLRTVMESDLLPKVDDEASNNFFGVFAL